MTLRVLCRKELKIDNEDDVVLVRRAVRELAEKQGFDSFATAALGTAVSELGRNVWVYAHRGEISIEEVTDGSRTGIQVEFRDQGPGIPDIEWAMTGGHSTASSLGLGLSGSKRLVDAFHIESQPGHGTRVRITCSTLESLNAFGSCECTSRAPMRDLGDISESLPRGGASLPEDPPNPATWVHQRPLGSVRPSEPAARQALDFFQSIRAA